LAWKILSVRGAAPTGTAQSAPSPRQSSAAHFASLFDHDVTLSGRVRRV
jgi:hypothetical protein